MHDRSVMRLKTTGESYDPRNQSDALTAIQQHTEKGEILTGLLYLEPGSSDLHENLDTVEQPLNELGYEELCPGSQVLEKLNESFR